MNRGAIKERQEIKGYRVPPDSLGVPQVVTAGKPRIVKALQPVVKNERGHFESRIEPNILPFIAPEVCTPGKNGYHKPSQVSATGISFRATLPEVVLAKNPSSKDFNPHSFSTFGMIQGLKTNQIRSLLQDRNGNLWFSSDDGVTRYDGKYFSHFVISNVVNRTSIVLCMLEDQSGCLWFGTFGGGLIRFDGQNFTQFTQQEGLSNNIVNWMIQDRMGNFWIATSGGGISRFDGKTFTNYSTKEGLPSDQIRSLLEDRDGKIWIGTFGKGLSCFDGVSFINYAGKSGYPVTHIASLFQDKDGNIWIGSFNEGIVKFDGNQFTQYTEKQGLSNKTVLCFTQEENRNLWMGTSGGGISKFDGRIFSNFQEEDGLPNNYVRCALIGRQGNLWFGTRDGGLVRFNKDLFTHYTENEGLSANKVTGIMQDKKENLWFSTYGGGITSYDGKKFSAFSLKECELNSFIYSIIESESGDIWFGGDGGGITKFDGKFFTQYMQKEGLANNAVRCIAEDQNRNIWVGTYGGGVSKFDGKSFVNYTEKEGLSSNKIMCLFIDKRGTIWFGTDGGGITCFDGKNFTRFSVGEGLNNSTVAAIFQDRNGTMWFGTSGGGVTRYDGKFMVAFTQKEGLTNNFVTSLRQDKEGNLWIGTRFGPNILRADQLQLKFENSKPFISKNFSYDDGFLGIGCNLNALFEDKNGTIWVGSTNRLSAIKPHEELPDTLPPNIKLTNIRLFNENISWASIQNRKDTSFVLGNSVRVGKVRFSDISKWYFLPENLSLAYNNNFLSFSFVGISQKHTQKIRYQYKLEGLDSFWSSTTDLTEVSFGNLKPGDYCFYVKAMSSEGIWSNECKYSFSIRFPWWQTWWFYFLSILVAVFLIYSFIKLRERELQLQKVLLSKKIAEQTHELKEKNRELEVKNDELLIANSEKDKFFSIIAHDVRGPLGTFMLFTEIMAENLHSYNMDEIQAMVGSMKESASNLFKLLENLLEWTRMQRGLIGYSPEQLNMMMVLGDSIETMHHSAKNKSIALVVDVPSDVEVIADKNMLESIIRNLLSNAIKFTPKGGKVTIRVQKTNQQLIQVSVIDNGIGMDKNLLDDLFKIDVYSNRKGTDGEQSVGLGLLLCKDFVEKQNGSLWVESIEGKGSTFYFTLMSAV